MNRRMWLGLVLSLITGSSYAQLTDFRLGFVYQSGVINADGSVPVPNLPQVPWTKYTHLVQAYVFPSCPSSNSTPTVNSGRLDAVPAAWGTSFSDKFTTLAHQSGRLALVSMLGTNGPDWVNATLNSGQTQTFVNALLTYVNAHQYDGIDLDYEANPPAPAPMLSFVMALNAAFKNPALTWNHQPLLITVDTQYTFRQLNSQLSPYVDKLLEMSYNYDTGTYAGNGPGTHPWHWSAVRRDMTNPGYGYPSSYRSMDESVWWETNFFPTPYSSLAIGIPFDGAYVQAPKLGTNGLNGVTAISDLWDSTLASAQPNVYPILAVGQPFFRFTSSSWSLWSDAWTGPISARGWDNVTKASFVSHVASQLPTYQLDPKYGPVYEFQPVGGASKQLSDAFISYPSVRFIQEAVKWANEQKPVVPNVQSAGYMGGTFVWSVLDDYQPGQTGDAQYPLSTALAEAQDLNAWTYTAPVGDNDITVWQTDTALNTISAAYNADKGRPVTSIVPPAGPSYADVYLLNGPGGTNSINDSQRARYIRFSLRCTNPSATVGVFIYVQGNDGVNYWVEYAAGTGAPTLNPSTHEILYRVPDIGSCVWHSYARDLLADLQPLASNVTAISKVILIKFRPFPLSSRPPSYIDEVTLFRMPPPLGQF